MSEFRFRTAQAWLADLREGAISAEDLTRLHLDRIADTNPAINAVVEVNAEAALAQARAADAARARGDDLGPLHGLPMTVKDSFEAVGFAAKSGAPELKDHRPTTNADAVQHLIDAGANIMGKTNLPIYAGDFQSYNAVYGTTNNPWDTSRGPGGSSGGSAAALAAGMAPLELGSDIGGSIRNPAHYCGVYGHKPSYGIVSTRGHIPGPPGTLGEADLAVAGPLARSAEDLDLAMDILAAPRAWDAKARRIDLPSPRGRDIGDFRIGVWLEDPYAPTDANLAEVLRQAVDALDDAGADIRLAKPEIQLAASHEIYYSLLAGVMGAGFPEPVIEHLAAVAAQVTPDDTSLPALFARGATQSFRNAQHLDEARQQLRARWAAFFDDYDVLLCPNVQTTAFPHDHSEPMQARHLTVNGEPRDYFEHVVWAGLATVSYLPATVAPVGQAADGLPVGIQIIGPYLEDRTTIAFAAALAGVVGGFVPPPDYA